MARLPLQCLAATLALLTLLLPGGAAHAADLPRRSQLGAQLEPAAATAASAAGLRVQTVLPGLSAQALGMRVGDVITAVDGQAVASTPQLLAWLTTKPAGSQARLTVRRDDKTLELSGSLVERPREAASAHYVVEYGHVAAVRGRQRTLLSTPLPAVAGQRHPALLFVQGVTLSSIDQPLTDANAYSRIVAAFANNGFVTLRVEKPGVGDSEGGPATTVDFEQELDGYRQALKALRARPEVDPSRIFIFGHSMGGLWAPLLASEVPVRGIAVAGTGFRTWIEYALENTRRQSLLSGATAAAVHDDLTRLAPLLTGFLAEWLTPAQLRERHPGAKDLLDDLFEAGGTLHAGRALPFWHQVNALNLPAAWAKAHANGTQQVLALWGEHDFLVNGLDHRLLAEHLNGLRADSAQALMLENTDHAFLQTRSQADSFKHWGQPGKAFNPSVIHALDTWIRPLAGRGLR
jgi:pimeloyl-ACP methyl ester carboxylesterase